MGIETERDAWYRDEEIQRYRQTGKQTDKQTGRQTDTQTCLKTEETPKQSDRQTDRAMDSCGKTTKTLHRKTQTQTLKKSYNKSDVLTCLHRDSTPPPMFLDIRLFCLRKPLRAGLPGGVTSPSLSTSVASSCWYVESVEPLGVDPRYAKQKTKKKTKKNKKT